MASRAKVAVTGIRSIDRKLAALGAKVGNRVVRDALRAEAKDRIQPELKAREPEGPTKALKRSIIVRAKKRSRTGFGVTVGYSFDKFKAAKWHATFSEWGTHKMKGDRAMKRTYDATKTPAIRSLVRRIKAGIKGI